jgi:hypothetical protein
MYSDEPFGGGAVILPGDSAQLSPVASKSVWEIHTKARPTPHDNNGHCEYLGFTSVVDLAENRQVD